MIILLEILIFLGIVYYQVHAYASKDIPLYLKSLIFLCWCLSFVVIIFLPIDIYYVKL